MPKSSILHDTYIIQVSHRTSMGYRGFIILQHHPSLVKVVNLGTAMKSHIDKATGIAGMKKAKRKAKEGPLFINHGHRKAKERITSKTVSICIKKCLKAVGLDSRDITAHSLRHTCATIAISKGASYEEVKQLLRHKNINTTMIYNHTVNKMNNRSQSLVGEVLHTKK